MSTKSFKAARAVPLGLCCSLALAQGAPGTAPSGTGGAASSAAMPGASAPGGTRKAAPAKQADAKPIRELEAAAQRLRDAIHAMAQAPAGPKRTQAIKDANNALLRTHQAMASLPPELLTAGANEGDYKKAMDRLQVAAQDLRDAAHALAQDKASDRRNESMKRINKALLDTQQTMIDAYMASGK